MKRSNRVYKYVMVCFIILPCVCFSIFLNNSISIAAEGDVVYVDLLNGGKIKGIIESDIDDGRVGSPEIGDDGLHDLIALIEAGQRTRSPRDAQIGVLCTQRCGRVVAAHGQGPGRDGPVGGGDFAVMEVRIPGS